MKIWLVATSLLSQALYRYVLFCCRLLPGKGFFLPNKHVPIRMSNWKFTDVVTNMLCGLTHPCFFLVLGGITTVVVKVLIVSVFPPASSAWVAGPFQGAFACSNPRAGAYSRHAPISTQARIPGMLQSARRRSFPACLCGEGGRGDGSNEFEWRERLSAPFSSGEAITATAARRRIDRGWKNNVFFLPKEF